jgi:hypothetical protein
MMDKVKIKKSVEPITYQLIANNMKSNFVYQNVAVLYVCTKQSREGLYTCNVRRTIDIKSTIKIAPYCCYRMAAVVTSVIVKNYRIKQSDGILWLCIRANLTG